VFEDILLYYIIAIVSTLL